jgi:hypothetical protein
MADPDGPYHRVCIVTNGTDYNAQYYRSDYAVPLPHWAVNGVGAPACTQARMVRYKNSRICIVVSGYDTAYAGQGIWLAYSDDGGNTWSTETLNVQLDQWATLPAVAIDSFGGMLIAAIVEDTEVNGEEGNFIQAQFQDIGQPLDKLLAAFYPTDSGGDGLRVSVLSSFNICAAKDAQNRMYLHYIPYDEDDDTSTSTNLMSSFDAQYQTWMLEEESLLDGLHPTLNIDRDNNILCSVMVPDNPDADLPRSGTIQATIRLTGDTDFSDTFTFKDNTGTNIEFQDTGFNIVECFENPNRYVLTAVEWNSETSSPGDVREWVSADYGQTWQLLPEPS